MSATFRRHDEDGLKGLYGVWDENQTMSSNKALLARAREHAETLSGMIEADRTQLHDRSERGWTPPAPTQTAHPDD